MRGVLVCLCLSVALSGCVKPLSLPSGLHLPRPKPASGRTEVLQGALVLTAPPGFCVDPGSRQDSAEGAFVLWGSCAAIAHSIKAPRPPQKAMLSATIGPASAKPVETMFRSYESFFRSEAGRAALARSGRAADVEILAVKREGGLLLLKISDHSAPTSAPVDAVYWRAITRFHGHVSALSVLPLAGSGLDDETQLALLQAFDDTIREAN